METYIIWSGYTVVLHGIIVILAIKIMFDSWVIRSGDKRIEDLKAWYEKVEKGK